MKILLILTLALSVSACGSIGKSNKSITKPEPSKLENVEQGVELKKAWSTNVGSEFDGYAYNLIPAFANGVVYAANPKGKILAIDTRTGDKKWSTDLDMEFSGGLGLGDGLIYIGTVEAEVIAVDVRDGSLVWQKRVPSEVLISPVAANGRVIVQTIDGKVTALSTTDGEIKWSYQHEVPSLTLRGGATPVIGVGVVMCAFSDGQIVALDTNNGRLLWQSVAAYASGRNEVERLTDVDTQPVLKGSILYTASYQGQIVAAALGSRKLMWTKKSSTNRNMAISEETLFYTSTEGMVEAINRHTGEVKWTLNDLQHRQLTAPVIYRDWLVVGDRDDYIHIIDQASGRLLGRQKISGGVLIDPINFNDRLYTMSGNGVLSSWGLANQAR